MSQQNNSITKTTPLVEVDEHSFKISLPMIIDPQSGDSLLLLLREHNYNHTEKNITCSLLREPFVDFAQFQSHEITLAEYIEKIFATKKKHVSMLVISSQADRFFNSAAPSKVWSDFLTKPIIMMMGELFSHCCLEPVSGKNIPYNLIVCLDNHHMTNEFEDGYPIGETLKVLFGYTLSDDKECHMFSIPIASIIQINFK